MKIFLRLLALTLGSLSYNSQNAARELLRRYLARLREKQLTRENEREQSVLLNTGLNFHRENLPNNHRLEHVEG